MATFGRRHRLASVAGASVLALTLLAAPSAGPAVDPAASHAQCMGNLKQLATAMLMYAQDNKKRLPPARNWRDALYPYLRNDQVFRCPADKAGRPTSYAFNSRLSGRSLREFRSPAAVVAFCETAAKGKSPTGTGPRAVAARHDGMAGLAFVDGHVKMVRPAAAAAPAMWGAPDAKTPPGGKPGGR